MSTPKTGRLVAAAAALAAAAAAVAVQATAGDDRPAHGSARATLVDAAGNDLGTIRFQPRHGGKIAVRASTTGLPPGFHGFHIHSVGLCEAPFTSAGGHLNPGGVGHAGHAGDMPVLYVAADGSAEAEFEGDRFSLDDLFDADGSAVIVHAGPDNYANVPARYAPSGPDSATLATGDAGGRIACGVIDKGKKD